MKKHLAEYKEHLEKTIGEYMERPATERSAEAVKGMLECWMCMNDAEEKVKWTMPEFTRDCADKWAKYMVNDDGTTGAHWTIEQTSAVGNTANVPDWAWWITMNMMYSDYCETALKYGVSSAEFYADMAHDFLHDKDGGDPMYKLAAYYHGIVCPDKKY